MPVDPIPVPRTKLLRHPVMGSLIALECLCGEPVPYPGHPDDRPAIACAGCGQEWYAVAPDTLRKFVVV